MLLGLGGVGGGRNQDASPVLRLQQLMKCNFLNRFIDVGGVWGEARPEPLRHREREILIYQFLLGRSKCRQL